MINDDVLFVNSLQIGMDVAAHHQDEAGRVVTDGVDESPVEANALHLVVAFFRLTLFSRFRFVGGVLSRGLDKNKI